MGQFAQQGVIFRQEPVEPSSLRAVDWSGCVGKEINQPYLRVLQTLGRSRMQGRQRCRPHGHDTGKPGRTELTKIENHVLRDKIFEPWSSRASRKARGLYGCEFA